MGWKQQEERALRAGNGQALPWPGGERRPGPARSSRPHVHHSAHLRSAWWGPRNCQFQASFRKPVKRASSETALTPTAQRRTFWHNHTSWVSYNTADKGMVNTAFQPRWLQWVAGQKSHPAPGTASASALHAEVSAVPDYTALSPLRALLNPPLRHYHAHFRVPLQTQKSCSCYASS